MRIFLKIDWKSRISSKTKVYSLNTKNRELINEIFDKLHDVDKLDWTQKSTSFSYSIFYVWKIVNEERKERIVVDIRDLNAITQFDVYLLLHQIEIIAIILECQYIIVIDCSTFFYQWRIHLDDRYRLIVVNHKE